ncbi:PD-(D/E)XK motif protein [Nocardioides sp. WL0053]|uniref:PD-(D/E)XK motif protein n=1 Tax=Nocardioides jiangsuensis TaxID=2866161 RepID=A0ABS7RLM5_9ACTN|nr:PD-(D/E)XK motif protein [Nocardioides jiangsuensis]MBY9075950.1 PD-(D/E)XK motif protein [Nocardioides jiangsuensis]
MTTGADLRATLQRVTPPADHGFSVLPVPGADGYRVGRGADNAVALLTPADQAPEPPTRLRRLSLDPRLRCRVEAEGSTLEDDFGVVQFHVDDEALLQPFLDVAAAVIRMLGKSPAPGEVSTAMRRLVRLFDRAEPARGSVLGLWAELLVIDRSTDVAGMVDAWHAYVDARFDFAAAGSRLEVKATTRDARVHEFALRQLVPVEGAEVLVASVMTTETHAGTAIGELVSRVERRLDGDATRQMRVHEQVAATLGPDWVRHTDRRFDEQQGIQSLVVLPAAAIPRVASPPPAVIDVRLTVDCTDVPPEYHPKGLAALIRSVTS